jgi:hypothetical protein
MTRARGLRLTAEIQHDGHHFRATLAWNRGHGGPAEVVGVTEDEIQFRLRGLDPSVKFRDDYPVPRRKAIR